MRFSKKSRRAERGQTLVIAALIMLLVAVSVMLTFAVGHRTREKIKVQAVADASAYSLAVAEARTFNYFAWSNRAHIAHDISILSIHSHESYLSWYDDLMRATGMAHNIAGGVLAAYCIPCAASGSCCQSCTNSWRAFKVGKLYRKTIHKEFHQKWVDSDQYKRTLWAGSKAHMGLISTIGGSQRAMLAELKLRALTQGMAAGIAEVVDDKVEAGAGLAGVRNVGEIDSAVGWHPEKAEDWLEIAAGTRWPAWLTKRGFIYASGHWWDSYSRATREAGPCTVVPVPPSNSGNSKVLGKEPQSYQTLRSAIRRAGDNRSGWSGYPNGGGHAFGAYDEGTAFALWVCDCPGFGAWNAKGGAYSDPNDSRGGESHKHGFFIADGKKKANASLFGLGGCDNQGNCGIYQGHMRMKLSTEAKRGENFLWNQPHTIAFVTKQANARREVWDFDFQAELGMPFSFTTTRSEGDQGTPMAAVAGGLAYYHKPNVNGSDGWREPPSMWNPFWRAKLHPVRPSDARQALLTHPSGRVLLKLGDDAINY